MHLMTRDLHQILVERILDPLDLWRCGERATARYEREFEASQFWSADKISALQLTLLQKLLTHAYKNCPYYTEQFDNVGLQPSEVSSLADLRRLPVLEKANIQRRRDDMVSRVAHPDDLLPNKTGGSTGAPLSFYVSHDRNCSREAAARRHNRWAGWNVGDKVALVWGATPDLPQDTIKARLRNWLVDRQLVLDTSAVTAEQVRRFHSAFERFRPKIILAYAQSLVLVTKQLMAEGLSIRHSPFSIVTSAEVLSKADRELVESFFRCKVFNRYGCREVSVIASECERHDGMHVMAEGLYVEILDGDHPAEPGQVDSVVVTDLRNYAMPLIRYRIGDMSSINFEPCECGRSLPRLNSLAGRVTDFLVADDGRLVSGVFLATYVLADRPTLGQVRITQQKRNQVCFELTGIGQTEEQMQEDVRFLQDAVARHLGPGTKFEYKVVDSIPNSASGKFTFCRSDVAAEVALSSETVATSPNA